MSSLLKPFKIITWNINSVRLRINQVCEVLKTLKPDVLCLQETKCPDDKFPLKDIKAEGYPYIALNGQKGYHGVATISKIPFVETKLMNLCEKQDSRYLGVTLKSDITIHNFYVPAGGDIPDPELNEKFAHKLNFITEMGEWGLKTSSSQDNAILVGDLNVAPLEHDVWSHKQLLDVVSHTPIETDLFEKMRIETGWEDAMRHHIPHLEKLYTWWSYRSPDWQAANKGRRLDHIWLSKNLKPKLTEIEVIKHTRSWERPSDHVPVQATFAL